MMVGPLASLTAPTLLAALLAGVASALLVASPAQQLSRVRGGDGSARLVAAAASVWQRWCAARPDAAPLRHRLCVALGAGLASGLGLPALGLPAGAAWAVTPAVVAAVLMVLGRLEPAGARRRRAQLVSDLPQALELISAGLYAGMPLRSAVGAVANSFDGPVGADLSQVLALMNLGTSDAEAWATLSVSPEWRPAAVDLARSFESGTRTVEVLVQHARDARTRRHAAIEVGARAVGVRSVLPLMTCFLPAFLLLGVVPAVASALLNALP